jgi:hypothetical protein
MAKVEQKNVAPTAPISTNKNGIDTSIDKSVLPEGFSAEEFQLTGQLTPIYAAKDAFEERWPKLIGFMKGIEELPTVREGKDDAYTPMMIRFKVIAATKGIQGKDDKREIVEIPIGSEVLLPISGNLRNNAKLLAAATNPNEYFLAQVVATGQVRVGKPSPMWELNVQLHPKGQRRAGTEYAMMVASGAPMLQTATGAVYDPSTGELVSNGNARPVVATA